MADRVTVLRRGRTVITVAAAETTEVDLARAMLGSAIPGGADRGESRSEKTGERCRAHGGYDRGWQGDRR